VNTPIAVPPRRPVKLAAGPLAKSLAKGSTRLSLEAPDEAPVHMLASGRIDGVVIQGELVQGSSLIPTAIVWTMDDA
jgi:hypothetical protein